MITTIDVTILYVGDQDRMLGFMAEKLGFEKTIEAPMGPRGRWLEVRPKGARTCLALLAASAFDRQPDEDYPATFSCDDLERTRAELGAAGVEVSEPVTEPWGTYIQVSDPEGRKMIVHGGVSRP